MKHVEVICDEWYPVFSLWQQDKPTDHSVEIPDELWERWVKIESDFEDLQLLLKQYYAPRKWPDSKEVIDDLSADRF